MSKLLVFYILIVPIIGIAATLASGLYVQDQSHPGMTHFSYGLPLSWHEYYQSITTPPFPLPTIIYHWDSFIIDTATWSIILGIPAALAIAAAYRRLITKRYEQKPTQ